EGLEYYQQAEYPAGIISMNWGIARAQYVLHNYSEALSVLQTICADTKGLKNWAAQCHDYLGRTYAAMNQPEEALAHFQLALPLYTGLGNTMEAARVQAMIGQWYQTQGKLDQALPLYQRALKTFNALDNRIDQSVTLFAMGQLEMKRGHFDVAENYLKQS